MLTLTIFNSGPARKPAEQDFKNDIIAAAAVGWPGRLLITCSIFLASLVAQAQDANLPKEQKEVE